MQLEIITPDQDLFSGEATSVVVPAVDGYLGIMNNHAPLISTLKAGDVVIKTNGAEQTVAIKGGVVEVLQNKIVVLAD